MEKNLNQNPDPHNNTVDADSEQWAGGYAVYQYRDFVLSASNLDHHFLAMMWSGSLIIKQCMKWIFFFSNYSHPFLCHNMDLYYSNFNNNFDYPSWFLAMIHGCFLIFYSNVHSVAEPVHFWPAPAPAPMKKEGFQPFKKF